MFEKKKKSIREEIPYPLSTIFVDVVRSSFLPLFTYREREKYMMTKFFVAAVDFFREIQICQII